MAHPAAQPTISNLPEDLSRGSYALITHSVLTSLALVAVTFRCTARFLASGLRVDDYLMVLALVSLGKEKGAR